MTLTDPTTAEQTAEPTGPLRLPPPRSVAERLLVGRLGGHVSSRRWLPDLPELGEMRVEHLRLVALVQTRIDELGALLLKHHEEDAGYENALRRAAREDLAAPEDERTPVAVRAQQRAALEDALWASAFVLAEHVDSVIAAIAEREDELLGGLREQMAVAEDKRREAEGLLAQAKATEWRISRLGQWVLGTAADGPLGRGQPAPRGDEPRPAMFNEQMARTALERSWHAPPASPPPLVETPLVADVEDQGGDVNEMISTRSAS